MSIEENKVRAWAVCDRINGIRADLLFPCKDDAQAEAIERCGMGDGEIGDSHFVCEVEISPLPQENKITMSRDFFEHLLNCMANMEISKSVNADGISEGLEVIRKVQEEGQKACDKAYREARELFHNGIQPKFNNE